jgi:hypothetical protein
MPAVFQRRLHIYLQVMVQANFVFFEGSYYATLFENDGVIWYHVGRPFSQG